MISAIENSARNSHTRNNQRSRNNVKLLKLLGMELFWIQTDFSHFFPLKRYATCVSRSRCCFSSCVMTSFFSRMPNLITILYVLLNLFSTTFFSLLHKSLTSWPITETKSAHPRLRSSFMTQTFFGIFKNVFFNINIWNFSKKLRKKTKIMSLIDCI